MKRLYLLFVTVIVSVCTMANPITPDEARQRISQFMTPHRAPSISKNIESLQLVETSYYQQSESTVAASYYVFNTDGKGYVIASADDRVPAVLGYSENGTFVPEKMPDNMRAWLQEYDKQMEYLNCHPEAAARRTVTGAAIAPLIKTKWNQRAPYNNFCPMDGENHSLTGCVATAFAQIMYYHKWPAQTTTEIPGYTLTKTVEGEKVNTEIPAIPAGTVFDWDNMKLSYNGSESEAEQDAVATLMQICGTAVNMDYSATLSLAFDANVATALVNYLDYDLGTRYLQRSDYRYAEWCQMMYDELAAGRPILYGGQSAGGGHAFIVDGYRSDDYFHINWGWGGGSDNYFLLSILDSDNTSGAGASSSTDGYSFGQDAIIGIQPNTGIAPQYTVRATTTIAESAGGVLTRSSVSQNFRPKIVFNYMNKLDKPYMFDCGVAAFSEKDEYLGVIAEWDTPESVPVGTWYTVTFPLEIGRGMTEGIIYLVPMSRQHGTELWYPNLGAERFTVPIVISTNSLKVIMPTFALNATLDIPGKKEAGSAAKLNATIKNDGTLYMGEVFLLVNNEMVGGRHIDMSAGESTSLDFTFYPKKAGNCKLELCTREYNYDTQKYDYTPFASTTLTIEEAKAANISMKPTTVNMNKSGVVEENKAVIKLDITNNGDTEYDNVVIVKLYKLIPNTNQGTSAGKATKEITLAAGESTEEEVQFDDLESGATYFYWCYFMSKGEEETGYPKTPMFVVNYDTGIREALLNELEGDTVKVYNANGIQVAEVAGTALSATLKTMPKGVYIVRSGKKSFKMVQPY